MDIIMNNENLKIVSERLKSERIRLGLKQTDVLKQIDVAISTFSNYENGIRSPDIEFLLKLAELGYDAGYILTGKRLDEATSDLTESEQIWLEIYRKLPKDDSERLMKMAKSLL